MAENVTFRQLAVRFASLSLQDKAILATVGKHLKKTCISYIGVKQTEWEELKKTTEKLKERLGAPANAPLYRSGESKDDIHYKTESDAKYVDIYSNSDGLAASEYGTPTQPARPVFALAVKKEQDNIESIVGYFMMAALGSKYETLPKELIEMDTGTSSITQGWRTAKSLYNRLIYGKK